MFTNALSYYHGTTNIAWEQIKKSGKFVPSTNANLGKYYITKGTYFVADNPFIALWYAWLRTFRGNNAVGTDKICHSPIVLKISFAISNSVLNLLSSKGQIYYHNFHCMHKAKFKTVHYDVLDNLDSYLGVHIFGSNAYKAIMAAFNEGKSYQKLIQNSNFVNEMGYDGHKYGDHIEICFSSYANTHDIIAYEHYDIVGAQNEHYWKHLCMALTETLPKAVKLKSFMRDKFYGDLFCQENA